MSNRYQRTAVCLALLMFCILVHPGLVVGQTIILGRSVTKVAQLPDGRAIPLEAAVRATADGTLLLLDPDRSRLIMFPQIATGRGDLPAEVRGTAVTHAGEFATSPEGTLFVIDGGVDAIAKLHLDGTGNVGLDYLPLPLRGLSSVCLLGEQLVVMGNTLDHGGSPLHIYALSSQDLRSVGEAFGAGGEGAQLVNHRGLLLCAEHDSLIFVASRYYPELRAYRENGVLLWARSIAPFDAVVVKESPSGVSYAYPGGDHMDIVISLFRPDAEYVAIQAGRRRRGAPPGEYVSISTHIYSATDGELQTVQHDLPLVKGVWRNHLIVQRTERAEGVQIVQFRIGAK